MAFPLSSTDGEQDHEVFRVDKVDNKTGLLVLENSLAVQPFPKNYSVRSDPDPIGKRFDFSPPTRVIIERYSIPQITVIARDGGDRQSEAAIHVVFINMTGEPAFLEPTFDTDFTGNTQWAQECE